jgi:glycosyltransferase involved in cell wall biosynthesis
MPNDKPKLLLVTTVPGTFAVILKGQPKWLAQHFDVTLASSLDFKTPIVEENEGMHVQTVQMSRGINPLQDIKSIWTMVGLMRRVRPDVVHSYTPKAGLIAMISGLIVRVPVRIHTFTGLIFPTATGFKKRILMSVDRLICRAATHVVPESQGVKYDLVSARITTKTLDIIGNGNIAGVDVSHFDPLSDNVKVAKDKLVTTHAIPESAIVFGFVGRLNRDKGLDELAAAFDMLADENTWLMCAGDVDKTAPPSGATLQMLKNHPRVVLTGFLSDIRGLLARSDAVVLPSYREGFPNVLLQAGAMATPLIGTDISGSSEIIQEGRNGFIVPVKDAPALAQAFRALVAMPKQERTQMGRHGRERVASLYEQSVLRAALLEFYQHAMKR